MSVPVWFSNLAFWNAQVALLVLAAGLLVQLLRIRQPRVLLIFWRALLAISLLLPLLEPWRHPPGLAATSAGPDLVFVGAVPTYSPAPPHWHFPGVLFAEILGAVILLGIVARLTILAMGLLKLRHFRETSWPVPADAESAAADPAAALEQMRAVVRAHAEFRLSSRVPSPVTFGFARPVILLPERFLHLQPRFQCAIACHELLHVRRHDWAHHFAEEILRAIFWFHPAVAWLIARLRLAREQVVDLEVVRITEARKPYVQALLEFTSGRSRIAAIPAPPFLAERQFAERVALILKEARMSRKRLMVSLATIACSLTLAVVLAAWAFPLKGAPRLPQNAPRGGVVQGAAGGEVGGVPGGIVGGVGGGVIDGVTKNVVGGVVDGVQQGVPSGGNEPTVDRSTLWLATVKRDPMILRVRALGTLVRSDGSANLVARLNVPEVEAKDIEAGQNAAVSIGKGNVKGYVSSISMHVEEGNRSVDIALDSPLPEGTAPNARIEGTVDVGKIENALNVGRPALSKANSEMPLFKVVANGAEAERVNVKFGRASVTNIEVLSGLSEGDTIILSDMSQYDKFDRIRIQPPLAVENPSAGQQPSGVPQAGKNGYSSPTCIYCPTAQYPQEARDSKAQGSVELAALVTPDGRAQDITVIQPLPHGLTESAIATVKQWKFKPATGPDGNPATVKIRVDVAFHLYQ
jgi:TonB family protein